MKAQIEKMVELLDRWRRGLAYPTDTLYDIEPIVLGMKAELAQPTGEFVVWTRNTRFGEDWTRSSLIATTFGCEADANHAISRMRLRGVDPNREYEVRLAGGM